ncbi:hypothetical protein BS17DRAFT_578290 [Gyrodon lividus]|nr:hypothetical protein BS17DRAFT_578290 [Gyrodon lividus]
MEVRFCGGQRMRERSGTLSKKKTMKLCRGPNLYYVFIWDTTHHTVLTLTLGHLQHHDDNDDDDDDDKRTMPGETQCYTLVFEDTPLYTGAAVRAPMRINWTHCTELSPQLSVALLSPRYPRSTNSSRNCSIYTDDPRRVGVSSSFSVSRVYSET